MTTSFTDGKVRSWTQDEIEHEVAVLDTEALVHVFNILTMAKGCFQPGDTAHADLLLELVTEELRTHREVGVKSGRLLRGEV